MLPSPCLKLAVLPIDNDVDQIVAVHVRAMHQVLKQINRIVPEPGDLFRVLDRLEHIRLRV